ncbi:MAG TPA: histidine phosphatase family protein [Candidatus Omnitrophota bacterium]|nr:histidine phosphatase family protein [Candidatus Omnitrophota bacterium]
MTRLLIVRHAESALNFENRIQGHRDSGLTFRGMHQAQRLARKIKNIRIDKIYSSDLGRAYSTTRAITKHLKLQIVRDPLLREIHLGDWEGMTPEEVDNLYDKGYQKWLKKPSGVRIPRSEPIARFRKRVTTRVRQIARANRGKTVLVVTHGGVITALLAQWLDADFDKLILDLHLENTGLTLVDETDKKVRVRFVNDSSHLLSKGKNGYDFFNQYPQPHAR